ncbi:MAG: formylglycine-generating enzyme family protein, partial [Taibaiella sp.]|nr:formylglycine-generating enzyme family protein [Taibaiella sp.]
APVVSITAESDGLTTNVVLTWKMIPTATKYIVFQNDDSIATTQDTSFALFLPTDWTWQETPTINETFHVDSYSDHDMVFVPAGTFTMGDQDAGEFSGTPLRETTLTNDFLIGRYEMTVQEYVTILQWAFDEGLAGTTISAHWVTLQDGVFSITNPVYADHPVSFISWSTCASVCDWLSISQGLEPYYDGNRNQTPDHNPYEAEGYRLPTEAEWEYAARYGHNGVWPWGDSLVSCDRTNIGNSPVDSSFCVGTTMPVGSYPNGVSELGIHDMAGNVMEWVGDEWSQSYDDSLGIDPLGPQEFNYNRVIKGGGWETDSLLSRTGDRDYKYIFTNITWQQMGFRLCRTAP